jgi:hypothetical protein
LKDKDHSIDEKLTISVENTKSIEWQYIAVETQWLQAIEEEISILRRAIVSTMGILSISKPKLPEMKLFSGVMGL